MGVSWGGEQIGNEKVLSIFGPRLLTLRLVGKVSDLQRNSCENGLRFIERLGQNSCLALIRVEEGEEVTLLMSASSCDVTHLSGHE